MGGRDRSQSYEHKNKGVNNGIAHWRELSKLCSTKQQLYIYICIYVYPHIYISLKINHLRPPLIMQTNINSNVIDNSPKNEPNLIY